MKIFKSASLALLMSACAAEAVPAEERVPRGVQKRVERITSEVSFILTGAPVCNVRMAPQGRQKFIERADMSLAATGAPQKYIVEKVVSSIRENDAAWKGLDRDSIVAACQALVGAMEDVGFSVSPQEGWEEDILKDFDKRNGIDAPKPELGQGT